MTERSPSVRPPQPPPSEESPPTPRGHPVPFVSRFLLPLVKGGPLHVGRPLGPRAVAVMVEAWRPGARRGFSSIAEIAEQDAIAELTRLRVARARALLFGAAAPPLDEVSLRLGVAVHNLLALGHPGLGGRAGDRRQQRIVESTLPIAEVGAPPSAEEAVRRHSLLARLGEITRSEHTVEYWAGRRQFIGRAPPARLLALAGLRRVTTTSLRRLWFKEVGVPAPAVPVWNAVHSASPLGEALDPLRLEPPLAWERILPVLRFPALCRLVAGRLLEVGLEPAGGALVAALLRFVAAGGPSGPAASPEAVAFAVRFVAHLAWLHHLWGSAPGISGPSDLAALLVAAKEVEPRLLWPPDVARDSELAAGLRARLDHLRDEVMQGAKDRHAVMLGLCRFAAQGEGARAGGAWQPPPIPQSTPPPAADQR